MRSPDDPALAQRVKSSAALVIPAVGPKLAAALFEDCPPEPRPDHRQASTARRGRRSHASAFRSPKSRREQQCGAPNTPWTRPRCCCVASPGRIARMPQGHYVDSAAPAVAETSRDWRACWSGVVGFGTIGTAVAQLQRMGCRIGFLDPGAPRRRCSAGAGRKIDVAAGAVGGRRSVVTLHVAADRGDARHDR